MNVTEPYFSKKNLERCLKIEAELFVIFKLILTKIRTWKDALTSRLQVVKDMWYKDTTQQSITGMIKFQLRPNEPRKRRIKEPGEPKGVRNCYIFYCIKKRVVYKTKYPELRGVFVLVKLGKSWRKLVPEKKEVYNELAKLDKTRYLQEKKIFLENKVLLESSNQKIQESTEEEQSSSLSENRTCV